MDGISERVRLMGDLQAAVTEALTGTLRERGRGFASDREAWAELKECVERTKKMHSDIEKVHKETKSGRISKRYTTHDCGSMEVAVAMCECGANWNADEFEVTNEGRFVDYKYREAGE